MSKRMALLLGACVILLPIAVAAKEAPRRVHKIEQHGVASYYGDWHNGRRTANGEIFNENAATAASPTLPLGSKAKVTNERNGRSVSVRINDRGPYVDGRIIDLSKGAARRIGMEKEGVAPVTVEEHPAVQPTSRLRREVENQARRQQEREVADEFTR